MGFFRKIAGILGFVKDEAHEVNDEDNDADGQHNRGEREETRQPTRGFSVQVPVAVDKAHMGPIITPCDPSDGGVQGLRWYAKRLRIDEDGDVADEFFDELLPEVSSDRDNQRPLPSFKVKYNTHPALVKNQVLTIDGGIRQNVEFQGRLQWV